jgi:hypothetical protein
VLSRYYKSNQWNEQQDAAQYVNADSCLDPDGEDLPWDRFEESHVMCMAGNEPLNMGCPQRQQHAPRKPDEMKSSTTK